MKDLNRSQLILLALLLSFVTSLATGITTVTLMQQAPKSVTVPITHVVKETVDRIVPQENTSSAGTVIVKEEDLVVSAVADTKPAMWSITEETFGTDGQKVDKKIGEGFSAPGAKDMIVANASEIPTNGAYFVENSSGKFKADFVPSGQNKFSLLKIGTAVNGTDKPSSVSLKPTELTSLKAGQKIVVLGDSIHSFIYNGNPDINLLAVDPAKTFGDSIVIDLDGNVLGFVFPETGFISVSSVSNILKALPAA